MFQQVGVFFDSNFDILEISVSYLWQLDHIGSNQQKTKQGNLVNQASF